MRYRREFELAGPVAEAFAYLADFDNAKEWDPGVERITRLTTPPTSLGTRFDVVFLFRGRRQRMEYEVTGFQDGQRLVLEGQGGKVRSQQDTITFIDRGDRTGVSYESVVRLTGVWRLAEPFLRPTLKRESDRALERMAEEFERHVQGPR